MGMERIVAPLVGKTVNTISGKMGQAATEVEALAKAEAERARLAAIEAMQNRDASNLEQSEEAERLVQEAKRAEAEAKRAESAKAHAKGEGRATGLRSVWRASMSDEKAAAGWMWTDHRAELMAFVQEYADKAVRSGKRTIPGFEILEHKEL
jgi:hypothetical protein